MTAPERPEQQDGRQHAPGGGSSTLAVENSSGTVEAEGLRTAKAGSALADYRTFLSRAVRNPSLIGAVAPSSAHLAAKLAAVVPTTGTPVVVELGPGTGASSGVIADRLPAGARHLAIELDKGMVEHLRQATPWVEVIQGDAAHLGALLEDAGVESVDAVVSGLPWALFPRESQRAILHEVGQVLAPAGAFSTFAYLHALGMSAARRFRSRLGQAFDEVVTSRTIWRNFPPARTYVCRRPRL